MLNQIPCAIFRGGTSKGVFFMEHDLPADRDERDMVLLRVMGSPDRRQIDGLGGSVSTTSKAAIISASQNPDWDINYTFAQVSVDKPFVSYAGNCGNISSAVGPYAVETGLIKVSRPKTTIRIYNTNTQKIIHAHVATPDNNITYEGDFTISGVPGAASKIELEFKDPAGSMTGKLFPTGNSSDRLFLKGFGELEVSIVDVANPVVFVRAADLGMSGLETADTIDADPGLLTLLETIRGRAAVLIGAARDYRNSAAMSPGVPKIAMIASSQNYTTISNLRIKKESYDLSVRMMSMQRAHKTIALTGAMCTAAAALLPGTATASLLRKTPDHTKIRLGHADGIIQISVNAERDQAGGLTIHSVSGYRTARLIMKGTAYYIS